MKKICPVLLFFSQILFAQTTQMLFRALDAHTLEPLKEINIQLGDSLFADFAQMPIPSEGGSIQGIITKTFNGSDLVLVLNQYQDLMLDQEPCSLP